MPPAVTAATGVDALAHCAEAFTSPQGAPGERLLRAGVAASFTRRNAVFE
ncbi:iron-containing alcohol dehydrogenase [Craurococcus roseus]